MKKILLFPLRFFADCINYFGSESWYVYNQLTGNYWNKFNQKKLNLTLGDIVLFPFYLLFFLGYVFLIIIFGWVTIFYPALILERVVEYFFGNWYSIIAIFGFIGWMAYIAERPNKWPCKPWETVKKK